MRALQKKHFIDALNSGNYVRYYGSCEYRDNVDGWLQALFEERESFWIASYRASSKDSKSVLFAHFLPMLKTLDTPFVRSTAAASTPKTASVDDDNEDEDDQLVTFEDETSETPPRPGPIRVAERLGGTVNAEKFQDCRFNSSIDDLMNLVSDTRDRRPMVHVTKRGTSKRSDRLRALDLFLWIVQQQETRSKSCVRVRRRVSDVELLNIKSRRERIGVALRHVIALQDRYPHAKWSAESHLIQSGVIQGGVGDHAKPVPEVVGSFLSTDVSCDEYMRIQQQLKLHVSRTTQWNVGAPKRVRFARAGLDGGECVSGFFYDADPDEAWCQNSKTVSLRLPFVECLATPQDRVRVG